MRKRRKLGEMLLEAGIIEKTQLDKALHNHKTSGKKLGQYMIRESMVKEEAIVKLISDQLKIERYNPNSYSITKSLAKLLDVDSAKKFQAIPIEKKGSILTIAMTDPLDIKALDHIEILTDTEVESVICTEQELNLLISTVYGTYACSDGVMENIQEMEEMDVVEDETGLEDIQSASSLQDMAEEAPIIRLVNSVLTQAVQEGASDIHLSPEKEYIEIR